MSESKDDGNELPDADVKVNITCISAAMHNPDIIIATQIHYVCIDNSIGWFCCW